MLSGISRSSLTAALCWL